MTHVPLAHSPSPRGLSRTTRAIESALWAVRSCSCTDTARITVLHAPGDDDAELAALVSRRLVARVPDLAVDLVCAHPEDVDLTHGAHQCAVMDASERESARALVGYRWEPNQPVTGRLALTLDDVAMRVAPGVGLELRAAGRGLDAWAVEDAHQRAILLGRATRTAEVASVDGLHLLFRDETYVGDSPELVRLTVSALGGVRRMR
jgi:hypothetical protein